MKDIAYKLLWSTIEDFVGLWEILWEMKSILPDRTQAENHEIAKTILKIFLEQNLIKFYAGKWGSDELEEVDFNGALKNIEDEKLWKAPEINELCIRIGNTEKGEKFYNEELLEDLF
jgi:hypothetical protein